MNVDILSIQRVMDSMKENATIIFKVVSKRFLIIKIVFIIIFLNNETLYLYYIQHHEKTTQIIYYCFCYMLNFYSILVSGQI